MGQFFEEIPQSLIPWIQKQRMFWVATAPVDPINGHVNLSAKGLEETFHIIDSHRVWYEDLTGSTVETIAHLRERYNGRITLLFVAFEGPPKLARLFGKGTVYEYGTPEYERLLPVRRPGSRAVIMIDVHKVGTSCGWSVPLYDFKGHRSQLLSWGADREDADVKAENGFPHNLSRPPAGMKKWWQAKNTKSLDGLPGLLTAHDSPVVFESSSVPEAHAAEEFVYISKTRNRVPRVPKKRNTTWSLPTLDMKTISAFSWGVLVAVLCIHLAR